MKKQINLSLVAGFLAVSLFACNENNSSDATSPNRPQPNMNNRTATPVNTNSMNSNDLTNAGADTKTPDTDFLNKAGQGGMAEVELGKLAVAKAQSPEVKAFGQKMIDDHSKANNELKELAVRKNFVVPSDVSPSQKSMIEKLGKLSGADFDKAYVDAMVDDHETDVKLFKDEADGGKDGDVKAWAGKTLSTLQMHLDMIKGIKAKMK